MLGAMKTFESHCDRRSWIAATAALLAVICLSGGATLSDWRHAWTSSPAPVPSDRFPLPPQGTDIVGELQVTTTVYEDTLVEIARRYDLGYEEIVAANPGIDPW